MKKLLVTAACILTFAAGADGQTDNKNDNTKQTNTMKTIALTKADFLTKVANYETNPTEWKYLGDKPALIDFYASWCGPCRKEVPNLKAIYERFRDKGFEVYSVSLDDKRDAWMKAIAELELPWVHVSSLKGWDCPVAKRYGVTSVPKMYLLNPKGEIIAMDLRGEELEQKVASFFN